MALHSKGFHGTGLIFFINWDFFIANKEINRKITNGTWNNFTYRRISLPAGSLGAKFHCMLYVTSELIEVVKTRWVNQSNNWLMLCTYDFQPFRQGTAFFFCRPSYIVRIVTISLNRKQKWDKASLTVHNVPLVSYLKIALNETTYWIYKVVYTA